ncbi:MAG: hypothetical protein JOY71_06630 [Acetobacteraceae bacterium]|nr:hypothetical protein [Acetobacteraceae bacterium]MBV8521787.1 hypothetical protein [Acetobacteraceae bacterium]MBV8589631.1 hypothetical protein [Acetobacteraceae bacterium]
MDWQFLAYALVYFVLGIVAVYVYVRVGSLAYFLAKEDAMRRLEQRASESVSFWGRPKRG